MPPDDQKPVPNWCDQKCVGLGHPASISCAIAALAGLAASNMHGTLTIMQTLIIDTNGVVKKLEQRGFSRTQAEGITEVLKELDTSKLVTKADLDVALANQTTTIIKWITGMLLAQGALIVALLEYLK